MERSKILLNAEPFGFGPAAATAAIAIELGRRPVTMAYIGSGHTLELQTKIGYNQIIDITDENTEATIHTLSLLRARYDIFFTAMDSTMAELARAAGYKTIVYDALAWYWPRLDRIMATADLYLAQDFFGVRERLARVKNNTPFQIVPPIISKQTRQTVSKKILLNLGGIINPLWDTQIAADYAKLVIEAVRKTVHPKDQLVVTTSSQITKLLNDPAVKTLRRNEMKQLLSQVRYAIMTPGLGNIYDAAAYDLPTVWLPPANDSQAKQVQLLSSHGRLDAAIDWAHIASEIDYNGTQHTVLTDISKRINDVLSSSELRGRLASILAEAIESLPPARSKTTSLLDTFGSDGAAQTARIVNDYLEVQTSARA